MSTLFGKRKHRKRLRSTEAKAVGDEATSKSPASLVDDSTSKATTPAIDSDSYGTAHRPTQHTVSSENAAVTSESLPPAAVAASSASFNLSSMSDLGLAAPLVATCRQLGFRRPTPVQRTVIPFLIHNRRSHILAVAQTGSGKTAAFGLPILHHLAADPYGIYAVVLTPTRELAQQIHQQFLALGSAYQIQSVCVIGGLDPVRQALLLDQQRPHVVVATPGRLAFLLQQPQPPQLRHIRYLVMDEADRLLAPQSSFERHVAEIVLHSSATTTDHTAVELGGGSNLVGGNHQRREPCQTLLFTATMTKSLEYMENTAGAGLGRLPLQKFIIDGAREAPSNQNKRQKREKKGSDLGGDDVENSIDDDDDDKNETDEKASREKCRIPAGLKQEYVFMPSQVRDAYLLTALRVLMINGGKPDESAQYNGSGWTSTANLMDHDDEDEPSDASARSAIVFVATCERAAFVSELLNQVGVDNVALHSLLSQNRRLASLGKFKSQQVRVLVATDVASRGLDIPTVDLVINSELPRNPLSYIHRVGRTARAGRRGRAVSLVAESEIGLVHAAESMAGRPLLKSTQITDQQAIKLLGPVAKAARVTKLKLDQIGFDELVQKFRERKERDRKERQRIRRALERMEK